MILVRLASLSLTMLLLGAGAQVAIGAEPVRHSGRILAIDTARGQLVLEEVGPWQVRDGVTQVIRRTIALTPATEAAIVTRGNPAGGFASDFIEGAIRWTSTWPKFGSCPRTTLPVSKGWRKGPR